MLSELPASAKILRPGVSSRSASGWRRRSGVVVNTPKARDVGGVNNVVAGTLMPSSRRTSLRSLADPLASFVERAL